MNQLKGVLRKYFSFDRRLWIFYILLLISVYISSYVLAYTKDESIVLHIYNTIKYAFAANIITLLFFRRLNNTVFVVLYIVLTIGAVLYTPYAFMFGYSMRFAVINFLATNTNESIGFLQQIPIRYYLYCVLQILLCICVVRLSYKNNTLFIWKSRWSIPVYFIFGVYLTVQGMIMGYLYKWETPVSYSKSSYFYVLGQFIEAKKQLNLLTNLRDKPSTWSIQSFKPKYQDYIIVIGESNSADYMHLFGYPVNNTPFLDSVRGKININYYSYAAYTVGSLTSFFIWKDSAGKRVYSDNIVSLANKLGFRTYWISNQGSIGRTDSFGASLGASCTADDFLSKGGSFGYEDHKDNEMIPIFKNWFDTKGLDFHRMFFIHLMGSHTAFEQRLEGPLSINYFNHNVSQYLQTIQQTDTFLKDIYKIAKQSGRTFSMIYFSDHGLSPTPNNTLIHGSYRSSFHIPFIEISSDDSTRVIFTQPKSAVNFLKGYTSWVGAKVQPIPAGYKFFDNNKNDKPIMVSAFGKIMNVDSIKQRKILGK